MCTIRTFAIKEKFTMFSIFQEFYSLSSLSLSLSNDGYAVVYMCIDNYASE